MKKNNNGKHDSSNMINRAMLFLLFLGRHMSELQINGRESENKLKKYRILNQSSKI